ncbi:hypothetical protein [Dactylosporangium sp. CS-033363]|uniref:hypothetical protein n=1 Tax=Dactylosporangium sp. CS-033363 TaxID=3239935 RepID=UPI003D93D9FE
MAEHDATRELVQRAYADERFDAEAGLAEVVRRAGRPPVEDSARVIERRHTVNVQRRRRLALIGVFAGVVGVVLAAAAAAGGFGGNGNMPVATEPSLVTSRGPMPNGSMPTRTWPSGGPTPTISTDDDPGGIAPVGLPSQCAVGWDLKFKDGTFTATDRGSNCPPVDPNRIWLLDDHANGLIFAGSGEVYPTVTTGTTISPPFSFTVPQIPTLQPNHAYHLIYLPESVHPTPGQDANSAARQAMTLSVPVLP